MLKETLGTIVFQEQVIQVATAVAGFTPPGRAATAGDEPQALEEEMDAPSEFLAGAAANGIDEQTHDRVHQILGFSSFGFPKSHSAALAARLPVAWLRRYYPPEFLCALLNEQPMGFYPPDSLVHEAQRRGIRIAPPDANRSRVLCHVESPRPARAQKRMRGGLGCGSAWDT